MRRLIFGLLITYSLFCFASIKLGHQTVKMSYDIFSTTTWQLTTFLINAYSHDINGQSGPYRFDVKLNTYDADITIEFTYHCRWQVNKKSYPNPEQSLIISRPISANADLEPFPIGGSELITFSYQGMTKLIKGNYSSDFYNPNLVINFDSDMHYVGLIDEWFKNGGELAFTVNNNKYVINMDGFKEGYLVAKDCINFEM